MNLKAGVIAIASIVGAFVVGVGIRAAGSKGIQPLTEHEELMLRGKMAHRQESYSTLQTALKTFKPYLDAEAADEDLQDSAATVFNSRHISEKDYTICDGGGTQPICAGVPDGRLQLRPIPKPEKK